MSQIQTKAWTNPAAAVAKDINVGFTVSEILTIDVTNGGSWQWVEGMPAASYLDVDAGTITTTNGFTPVDQGAIFGAEISGFTNANPGVLTVDDTEDLGFAAGDKIKVSGVADDLTGTLSLNNEFTVASVTATSITLVENTSVTGYSVYVSGGVASRISNLIGEPIATKNAGIRGMRLGTGVVGANNASMVSIFKGTMNVT